VTRPHALAECFSALSGQGFDLVTEAGAVKCTKLAPAAACAAVTLIASKVSFVELTAPEMLAGMKRAQQSSVQGGRIHDLMDMIAAENAGADLLLATDGGFAGLGRAALKHPSGPAATAQPDAGPESPQGK
jgi:hypothetical protein